MAGTLYIVATPIGNLEDITLRAISILSDVDIILAEDTRVTQKLLAFLNSKFQIKNYKLIPYHQHSSEERKNEILRYLLQRFDIALVTDAGTPGISDPGNELIDFLLARESLIKIIPIPGASALTCALSVSGFRSDKFLFLGFLPKKKKQKLYDWLVNAKLTFAFYESPHRLLKSLVEIRSVFGGDTRIFIGRELTKMYEEFLRGKIDDVILELQAKKIKGEIVVIVENK